MKSFYKNILYILVFITSVKQYAQHHSQMIVAVDMDKKTLTIEQKIVLFNQTEDSLTSIFLNDWNNAFSSKSSPLAKRFSDEFYRGFHLANEEERGSTTNLIIRNPDKSILFWERTDKNPDYIEIKLRDKLAPNQKITLHLSYIEKIPSDKFTKYGYASDGGMNLKNWFLTPARQENNAFINYSNNNLDDIANAVSDFDIEIKVPKNLEVTSDLSSSLFSKTDDSSIYKLTGKNRTDFSLFIEPKSNFRSYKNSSIEVVTNLKSNKLDDIQKAIVIDRITTFLHLIKEIRL